MVTLRIEHPITDYATWRAAFDGFAAARRDGGVTNERVTRPVDDDREILIDLDFETEERAAAFLRFLEARVWSTPANSPALAGRPVTRIVRPVA